MKIKHLITILSCIGILFAAVNGIKSIADASTQRKTGYFRTGDMKMPQTYPLDAITTMSNGDVFLIKNNSSEVYLAQKKKFKLLSSHERLKNISVTPLNDARVFIAGQSPVAAGKNGLNRYVLEEYNPSTDRFKVLLTVDNYDFPLKNTIKLMNGNVFLFEKNMAYVYDVQNNQLSSLIQIEDPKYRYFSAESGALTINDQGKVFIFGSGYCKNTDPNHIRNFVFVFDPDTNKISFHGNLKMQRIGKLKVYTLNHNEIAVFGGRIEDGKKGQSLENYEIYNIQTGLSKIAGDFPVWINDFSDMMLISNNKVITNIPYGVYNNLYKPMLFDIKLKMKEPASGVYGSGVDIHNFSMARLHDGCFLFAGGTEKGQDSKKAYKYCP